MKLVGCASFVLTGHRAPTQRVGIHPDVEIEPTIAGVEAGRDEVLEAGIRQILGSSISASKIERLARP
jgi:C-terminal processing protease CtpA/Prc